MAQFLFVFFPNLVRLFHTSATVTLYKLTQVFTILMFILQIVGWLSTSATAFSATGFLLMFLALPISNVMPRVRSAGLFFNARKPGAGSTRIVAGGSSREWSATNKVDRLSRRVAVFSSGMIQAEVKDVEVSRRTRINCLLLRRTSAAKEMPTTAGGSFVVWFSRGCGRLPREAQVWHV